MKKLMVVMFALVGVSASAGDRSYDALYTAETGYVTLTKDDTGNGANSSFHSSRGWSDKDVPPDYGMPHSGTNYYVGSQYRLYLDDVASGQTPTGFDGDGIVVAGEVRMNGAWGRSAICGPLTMLPGSAFYWVNIGHVTGGSVHIKGTGTSVNKPVEFQSGRNNETSKQTMNAYMSFSADADGELHWRLASGRDIGATFVVLDDWANFLGTFRIGNNFTIKTKNGLYKNPGRVIVSKNAMLQLTAASGTSEIGSLSVQSNGVLNLSALNGSQTVKIATKLELEPGALVIPQTFSGNRISANEFHPVFELSAEAVAAGLPDFETIPVALCGRQVAIKDGHAPVTDTIFPRLEWVVRDGENGGKIVGFSWKEMVAVTKTMSYTSYGFDPNGTGNCDPSQYWGDGAYPSPDKDYFSYSKNLAIRQAGNPFVFPGDSLFMSAGLIYAYFESGDITISNLFLSAGGKVRIMNQEKSYTLRGKIRTLGVGNAVTWTFNLGDQASYTIASDISGDGILRFDMDTEVGTSNWKKTLTVGTVELAGDNSAYSGKMRVDCWQTAPSTYASFFGDAPFVPGPNSNVTLRVSNQANLGGPLPSFAYDALTVSNECRLALKATATFDEQTRGWFFPANAYLRVEKDAVATVKVPVTFGTKLTKEGAGALMLGGTAAVAPGLQGRPEIKVEKGAFGFVSSTAIGGVDVTFGAGASLRVVAKPDDETLAQKGVDLTDATLSSVAPIPVEFDMTGVDVASKEDVSVAICTVPTSAAKAYANLLSLGKPAKGYSAKLVPVDNHDETTTLVAECEGQGLMLLLR